MQIRHALRGGSVIVLLTGRARVVRNHLGNCVTVATLSSPEPIGRMIDKWALSLGMASSVRYGRTRILNDLALHTQHVQAEPLAVASLAVGPGKIFDLFDGLPSALMRVVGVDSDDAAQAFCAEEARKRSLRDDRLRFFRDNLVKLSLGRSQVSIPRRSWTASSSGR